MSDDDVGEEPARARYGAAYERLARLEAEYDSGQRFELNLNVRRG